MKTKMISAVCMLSGIGFVVGQTEYDDMYFTSKDRVAQVAAVKKEKPQNSLNALSETNAAYQAVAPNISMQGYTGRTINPDYQPGGVAVVTSSYFTPNYQPTRVNNQLYTSNNNNFNNFPGYWSPYSYYGGRYGYGSYSPYGYGYNNWGYSPYSYGGFYDPYYSNWGYSPYGFGNSLSMYYGMGYGYGWGGGYYGYGCPTSYYGSYPGTVVVVNNPDNHVNTAYGKRQSRSTYTANSNTGARGSMLTTNANTTQDRGGRVASTSTSNSYYQRGWRQDPAITQSSSSTSGSRYSGFSSGSNTRSGWSSFGNSNDTRSSWGNSNSSFSGTTRSSMSTGSFTGGTRSSGSSFSGGSSVGGSRSSGGGSSSGGRGRGN